MRFIDLRSDTVTQPTQAMREAMARAEVGDDVYGEDPTTNRLEELAAERLGKEAALFVASGTMGNLVALLAHGGRGDEMILGERSHTFLYEGGGSAGLAGIHARLLPNDPDGTLNIEAIEGAIRPNDVHAPRTRLIALESTHNRCGGRALSPEYLDRVGELAHAHGIAVHLDGARLFNAAIALDVPVASLARSVDSVLVCLSKGLGAPVGSLLLGTRAFIERARRMRKLVGGGMRQAGVLAAAGIYALEHHVERLALDHTNARRLAEGIASLPGLTVGAEGDLGRPPQTNLVYFQVNGVALGDPSFDGGTLSRHLRQRGVLANPLGRRADQMRMVTHLDVTAQDIDEAVLALRSSLDET